MINQTKIYDQDGNITIGVIDQMNGNFIAMTYSQSKTFKSFKAADKWLQKYL